MRCTDVHAPLVAATAIAGGTLAYADPVRFDNDGSFEWTDGVFLDITKPAHEQTGQPAAEGSFRYRRTLSSCCAPHQNIAVIGATLDAQIKGDFYASVREFGAQVPQEFGPRRDWESGWLGYYYSSGIGFGTEFDKPAGTGYPGDTGYMAARFDIGGQTHYGWMSLYITRHRPNLPTFVFHLVAWGYETDPDTPLPAGAVPAPGGALAALALGAVAGASRGRRMS